MDNRSATMYTQDENKLTNNRLKNNGNRIGYVDYHKLESEVKYMIGKMSSLNTK